MQNAIRDRTMTAAGLSRKDRILSSLTRNHSRTMITRVGMVKEMRLEEICSSSSSGLSLHKPNKSSAVNSNTLFEGSLLGHGSLLLRSHRFLLRTGRSDNLSRKTSSFRWKNDLTLSKEFLPNFEVFPLKNTSSF